VLSCLRCTCSTDMGTMKRQLIRLQKIFSPSFCFAFVFVFVTAVREVLQLPRGTIYPQKLTLTSHTSGCR
jgi:hypothetical protein